MLTELMTAAQGLKPSGVRAPKFTLVAARSAACAAWPHRSSGGLGQGQGRNVIRSPSQLTSCCHKPALRPCLSPWPRDSTGSGSEVARGNGVGRGVGAHTGSKVMQSPGTNLSSPAPVWETMANQ